MSKEQVVHPEHYNQGIECWDYTTSHNMGFLDGNVDYRRDIHMGMYTELNIGLELKKDTPDEVINIIEYMISDKEQDRPTTPNHPLFSTNRWDVMLTCGSYYFNAKPVHRFEYDEIGRCWFLTNVSNLKNYNSEIEKFLDWISPYINDDGFFGYMRYEEDAMPTLLINDKFNHKIRLKYDDGEERVLAIGK